MTPLSEYIRNKRGHFDTEEPLPGHFDRFESKLEKATTRKVGSRFLTLKIAAAIIAGVVITYAAIREFSSFNRNAGQIFSSAKFPELKEAEQFYNVQMNLYYNKLQNLRFNNDQSQKQQILEELSDMDRQVRNMKRDLRQNPDDERVVHAIINYYQVKLDFMDMIITRTQESNNTIL